MDAIVSVIMELRRAERAQTESKEGREVRENIERLVKITDRWMKFIEELFTKIQFCPAIQVLQCLLYLGHPK